MLDIFVILELKINIPYTDEMDILLGDFAKRYTELLLAGERHGAEQLIAEAAHAGVTIAAIYQEILTPAQQSIGELWHKGEIGIAEEHRATEITLDVMRSLQHTAPPRPSLRRRVMVTTMAGDQHLIGAKMVSDLFCIDGWTVDFLGVDTPTAALIEFAKKREPHLIAISVSIDQLIPQVAQVVSQMKELPHAPLVMLGGCALYNTNEDFGADGIAKSAPDAVRIARELMKFSPVKTSLPEYLTALGSRIQSIRKSQEMSQKSLGEASSLDRAYISSLENGKQNVTIGALIKIADALTVPLRQLLIEE